MSDTIFTFLFTDIEGSTKLWEQFPAAMQAALARHDAILRDCITTNRGHVFKTVGDAFYAVFDDARAALDAAIAMQRALCAETWDALDALKVRVALHAGAAEERDADYFGPTLNRVARILAVGHGEQILLWRAARDLVSARVPDGITLRDLGEHRLKDLVRAEHIYQLSVPGLRADFPPLRSLDTLPNNLPAQITSFIGRERELAEIKSLIAKAHLITLTGAGGIGKSRLALQTAADLLEIFNDGAWFVSFDSVADPARVPQVIASTLNVREESGQPFAATIANHLRAHHVVLLFDNCDHLADACAQIAEELLRQCARLKIIATCRAPLGITGENVYRVPPLALPREVFTADALAQVEAVRLFVDRALAAFPEFALTDANAPAIAQICTRLDGIPLAIELAAPRVKALSAEEILERLADRFRLLTCGSRTALPRQQTLRALIDWSYDLLDDRERALLRLLSVFVGGWTLDAAEFVTRVNDALDLITRLVDKSLALAEGQAESTRYRMLETIRQYAQDKLLHLDDAGELRQRHCIYFLKFAERADQFLRGPQQGEWLNRLEREHDNFRAALAWALESESSHIALLLSGALWRFWMMRGNLSEGRAWLDAALTKAEKSGDLDSPARARVLDGAGALALQQRDLDRAQNCFETNLVLLRKHGDKRGLGLALNSLGNIAQDRGEYDHAQTFYSSALALRRELADKWGVASSLGGLGLVALNRGEYARARDLFEENLALRRELGDTQGVASAFNNLAAIALYEHEYTNVAALSAHALRLFRELGSKRGIAAALVNQGRAALYTKDPARATQLLTESLRLFNQVGDRAGIAECFEALAGAFCASGKIVRAAQLLGAAEALREKIGVPLSPIERDTYNATVAAVMKQTDPYTFPEAWAEGRAFALEHAIAIALTRD